MSDPRTAYDGRGSDDRKGVAVAKRSHVERVCLTCGCEFITNKAGVRKNYCGRSCYPDDLKEHFRSIERAHEQKRKGQRDGLSKSLARCCVCGHDYKLPRGRPGRVRKCCSRECRHVLLHGYGPHLKELLPFFQDVVCRWCGALLQNGQLAYCSRKCCDRHYRQGVVDIEFKHCQRCGKLFSCRAGSIKACCSDVCVKRKHKSIRRHRLRAAPGGHDEVTLFALGERDGWRCHLCGGKVPNRDHKNRVLDPEIDHLVPVSAGGSHTWDNVALAHRRCNYERREVGPAQLRLLG